MMDFNLSNFSSTKRNTEPKHTKVMVLGSGPAGMSAALYASRAELEPVVLTGISLGGQASLTHIIENYPGFPEGIGGLELGELFQKQAERFGTTFEFDSAKEVDLSSRPFRILTDGGSEYLAETLIITTGASPNHLNVPGEEQLVGKGVSYCATCDGWFFKEKNVVVVGGGDSALEEGLFLTRFAKSVTIVHRRDQLRAGAILQRRAMNNPKIQFIFNAVVSEVIGDEKVQGVRLRDTQTGEERVFPADGVFIFIGHTPNTAVFGNQIETDELGYIHTDIRMQTNIPGVFAAGEVNDPNFRQVVTSAGMGAAAAIQATRFLEEHEEEAADVQQAPETT
jgi:thioredoxin reductase (NADPH)